MPKKTTKLAPDHTLGKFTVKTKKTVAEKSAYTCANPNCRRKALYYDAKNQLQTFGEVAHIYGRATTAPRNEPSLSEEEIKSEDNGIWLCSRCHTVIDNDAVTYPAWRVKGWKALAERELAYTSPVPMLTPPGHFFDVGGELWIGVHALVAPCHIPGIVVNLELEITSAIGLHSGAPRKYFDSTPQKLGVLEKDWRRFLFSSGCDENLYFDATFLKNDLAFLHQKVILLRLRLTGRYNALAVTGIVSDWEPVIVNTFAGQQPPPGKKWTPRFDSFKRNSDEIIAVAPYLRRLYVLQNGQQCAASILELHEPTNDLATDRKSTKTLPPNVEKAIADNVQHSQSVATQDKRLRVIYWPEGFIIIEKVHQVGKGKPMINTIVTRQIKKGP